MGKSLELKPTEHSYYCSESNYYVNGHNNFGRNECADWHDFKVDWIGNDAMELDDDYNHLFRFDIIENEDKPGEFKLLLFFILQRKGIFRPVVIHRITQEDMPEIEAFLSQRWQYMKSQWREFSEEPARHGRWIRQDDTFTRYMCSECESKNHDGHEKYCPACGAKMDAEEIST